jgi:hypothetical protein
MPNYPYGARGDARAIYPHVRREDPDMPAERALSYARHLAAIDRVEDEIVEWTDHDPYRAGESLWAVATLPDGVEIRVYLDDEPYDWGDCEPTEHEREELTVIGVGARIIGDDEDAPMVMIGTDRAGNLWRSAGPCTIWGYGFTSGDAHREAISCALECGMIDAARDELKERAYWAARDVPTLEVV